MAKPPYARGKRKERGKMNSTEEKFLAEILEPQVAEGRVVQWWYEKWTWALTEATPKGRPGIRYTPDFVALLDDGLLIVFEVKGTGNARRQDLNRAKLFADLFPLRIFLATQRAVKNGGGFLIEEL